MITVNVNGINYKMEWRHAVIPATKKKDLGKIKTTCTISEVIVPKEEFQVLNYGEAIKGKEDNFCKETARKLSLRRALSGLFEDKTVRRAFWNAYFSRTIKVQNEATVQVGAAL